MKQLGMISVCLSHQTHEMWVYGEGTKHHEIDKGDPQAPEKYHIIILSGSLTEKAEAMVYTRREKRCEEIRALGKIHIKKNNDGILGYAD